jgi:hypothetical protein
MWVLVHKGTCFICTYKGNQGTALQHHHCQLRDDTVLWINLLPIAQNSFWACDCAVNHKTVLSMMWQYYWQCCCITSPVQSHQQWHFASCQQHQHINNGTAAWSTVLSHHVDSAVTSMTGGCMINRAVAWSTALWRHINSLNIIKNGTVAWLTALSHHIHSAGTVAWSTALLHHINSAVKSTMALLHDQQRCCITSTVPSNQQRHCHMINIAIAWLTALLCHVNSTNTSTMALSHDWQHCHITSTAPTHQQQHCHRMDSTVASRWQCCHITSTALTHQWQHCRRINSTVASRQQHGHINNGTVDDRGCAAWSMVLFHDLHCWLTKPGSEVCTQHNLKNWPQKNMLLLVYVQQ